ncbi:MAG: YicC family protein [Clostridia bacterium]|nr:YicC family protein [Clostridia bacterium]
MRSMTGLGRGSAVCEGWSCEVELKSVNHRFLDLAIRLPRSLSFLEETLRKGLTGTLKRGHVEVFVTVRPPAESASAVTIDEQAVGAYMAAAARLEALGLVNDLTASRLLTLPGVAALAETEPAQEPVTSSCAEALNLALSALQDMRAREGESLRADLSGHLEEVARLRGEIAEYAPEVVVSYRNRLLNRLRQLEVEEPDPARIAQETAMVADRCAIDEELSRLESHIGQMRLYLDAEGETGKKMDFLIQEMNREANTIGSKCSSADIAQRVVDMKSAIEKLREQVQNVE